ncbi:cytochrome P450 [Gloeophyllum trabeum ATCC 11539]|uniref:Cytochrome P450 n=1 Tax=Gloeophyllum trabeum (strain ATCC 11539 / FP-39264 / Madison 617) TaxID=670483 RepID=S7RL23_GLOTA|nr:cytochrome P450 [Gloeophyllum trabeum ATCC 11539]EPQ55060.1 cytochrome P450 [Gloeophyllum trabeum ATCC 11539]
MLAIAVLSVCLLRIIYVLCYRLFFSPLRHLPGPFISRVTSLQLMYNEFTANRRLYVHGLHKLHGPVIRLGPNEVAFATAEAAKQIYSVGGSGYEKPRFYHLFAHFDGQMNMFSSIYRAEHAERRKRIADRFTKTWVTQPQILAIVEEHSRAFVSKMAHLTAVRNSVDVYRYLHAYALDSVTHYLFHPYGTHSIDGGEDMRQVEELCYHDTIKERYTEVYFPRLYKLFDIWVKAFRPKKGPQSGYVLDHVRRTCTKSGVDESTILFKYQNMKEAIPPLEIASEIMDQLIAGIDTTGDALCFLMWHLSLPESASIQQRLRAELLESTSAPIDDLPYLDAVVQEGLRVYGPAPMSFPRVVPDDGRVLEGYFLPGGTIVSSQPWTLHRFDTATFPDPEAFIPERWLDEEGKAERNRLFFAFAAGGRGCIGKNLAVLEMKMLLKEVYSAYKTKVAPDMTASMEISDQIIVSRPKDQICLLSFEPIEAA